MRRLALACLLLAAAGCDRVPIDPNGSSLLVMSPDLGEVLLEPDLRLRLVPDGQSGPVTVTIGGTDVPFDSTAAAFLFEQTLSWGLNAFHLTVADDRGIVQDDTLYALYLPVEADPIVDASNGIARTDAAAASLSDTVTLVSGGRGVAGQALASASVLRLEPSRVSTTEVSLLRARAGHTATPIAGGALLLGGTDGSGFVRAPEWVGENGEPRTVEVIGGEEGPAREGHVAQAVQDGGDTYVYLLGGRVPAGSGSSLSATLDVYRVVGTSRFTFQLERLSPPGGASGFVALADHVLAPIDRDAAVVFGQGDRDALALDWTMPGTATYPFTFRTRPAAALQTPRAGAAAVGLGGGLALVAGGRNADGAPVGTVEVYAAVADRTFRLPPALQLRVPRSDHIATIFGGSRILIGGGRPANGSAVVAYEVFQL